MYSGTVPIGTNRVHSFDLANASYGDTIKVRTESSFWWFTVTNRLHVKRHAVMGVSIVTNSRAFGRATTDPTKQSMARMITRGHSVKVGEGRTGEVVSVWHNDRQVF